MHRYPLASHYLSTSIAYRLPRPTYLALASLSSRPHTHPANYNDWLHTLRIQLTLIINLTASPLLSLLPLLRQLQHILPPDNFFLFLPLPGWSLSLVGMF